MTRSAKARRFAVLLDLNGPRISRFSEGEVNAAAVLNDTQSGLDSVFMPLLLDRMPMPINVALNETAAASR